MVRVDGSIAQSDVSKCVADILDSAALRKLGIAVSITADGDDRDTKTGGDVPAPGKMEAVSL
jgi:hypothetical protein